MYLSEIKIEGYKLFNREISIPFSKGLNLFVGENGCGKSTVIDAIRLLLNEDEYTRSGVCEEDFHASLDKEIQSDQITISGKFEDLLEKEKFEYLTWLDDEYNANLHIKINRELDKRNNLKRKTWGGEASNSFFEWEPLNDIQCVYLPPLRDAEKKLRATKGSRLARLLLNLSQDEITEKRKTGLVMPIEETVNKFNAELSKKDAIKKANDLINQSLKDALGSVFGQSTKIQFNDLTYERIVESLRLVFFPNLQVNENSVYRNLFENSLGYNNLIYLATILAEFEGMKDEHSLPRILLIEELEAHLHPQIQVKVLKYLENQAIINDIQIIITTHSTTMTAATPISNITCMSIAKEGHIDVVPLRKCGLECKAEQFINRWLDTTRSTLLFSKGVILVEGLAEAMLIPKLAQLYLEENKTVTRGSLPKTLEEAGIAVINMNGIFFQYFMQLYNGYQVVIPKQEQKETKKHYIEKVKLLKQKEKYEIEEFERVLKLPVNCAAITDNDPDKASKPSFEYQEEGNNPQLYLSKQLENMTSNCRVFTNLKTFEYDLALEKNNARMMIEILLENLDTDGDIKTRLEKYLFEIREDKIQNIEDIASEILYRVDSNNLGKGMFAQLLLEKIVIEKTFIVPRYIKKSIAFVLDLDNGE